MIDFDNKTSFSYDPTPLEAITKYLTSSDIELILVNNDEITNINNEFRHINKATDVLSFPSDPFPHAPLGSIIISIDKVEEIASQLGHTNENEIALLFIHGLLHLLGMDHECDKGEMRIEEERLVKLLNLPSSLIVRTLEE
jgi:probable rRNA maturation factor